MSFVPVLGRPDLTVHDGMRCMPAELGDMINNGGVAVAAGQTIASAASSVIAGSSPARSYPEPDRSICSQGMRSILVLPC